MIKHFLPCILLALALGLTSHLPTIASPLLEAAKEDFLAKRYHAAAETLNKVVTAEPANPEGYFWLGRALEELKDRDGAKTMYMSSFRLNPFGPTAPIAKKALMDLAAKQAQLDHPIDGPEVMTQTLQLIERQASNWKQLKMADAIRAAQYTLQQGNQRAANMGYTGPIQQLPNVQVGSNGGYGGGTAGQIQSVTSIRAQMQAQGASGNPYMSPSAAFNPYTYVGNPSTSTSFNNWSGYPGNGGGTAYGAGGAPGMPGTFGAPEAFGAPINTNAPFNPIAVYGRQPVSNLATLNTSYLRYDSTTQALRRQQAGVQSALELQKSANNLESLLGEKPRAGSPHLRALGTNLFVRNYSDHDDDSTPPVDPPLELKARQERLEDLDKGLHTKALRLQPPDSPR